MSLSARSIVVGLILLPAVCMAQVTEGQNRLLAKRAAEADAYRKLVESIKGLQVDSETKVSDFVTEYDAIFLRSGAFLRGTKFGQPRFFDDGTVEIDATITLKYVVTTLEQVHRRYYKGNRFRAEDFQKITVTNKFEDITVTGNGAPRPAAEIPVFEDFPDAPPPAAQPAQPQVHTRQVLRRNLPQIFLDNPRERLKAERAAEADAMRKLVEQIKGLRVDSETSVTDFVTDYDKIVTSASAFIKGVKFGEKRYFDDATVEVDATITLKYVVTTLEEIHRRHYQGNKFRAEDFRKVLVTNKFEDITVTGNGAMRVTTPPPPAQGTTERTTRVEVEVEVEE